MLVEHKLLHVLNPRKTSTYMLNNEVLIFVGKNTEDI